MDSNEVAKISPFFSENEIKTQARKKKSLTIWKGRLYPVFRQTKVCTMLCRSSSTDPLLFYVFLPAQPEQELVMVLWGSAAVYGLRLPESINFYDMSESSSHVPRSRGRVIAVRQRRGGPGSVTPVINLQRGTAAFTSAARTNQDIIAFAVLFYRSCQWSCHPRQTSQRCNPNNTKIFLIGSARGFRMRNHRHPGCS